MRCLQHNCRRTPEVVQALLVMATDLNFDMVLIQQPLVGKRGKEMPRTFNIYKPEKTEKYKRRNPRVWVAVNKEKEKNNLIVEERTDVSESPDVQIFDIYEKIWKKNCKEDEQRWKKGRKTRIINVYDQKIKGNKEGKRRGLLEIERWNEIIDGRTILAGDFNAHDPLWGSTTAKNSEHILQMIDDFELYIGNDGSYTRDG
jgi:hypothetical protein